MSAFLCARPSLELENKDPCIPLSLVSQFHWETSKPSLTIQSPEPEGHARNYPLQPQDWKNQFLPWFSASRTGRQEDKCTGNHSLAVCSILALPWQGMGGLESQDGETPHIMSLGWRAYCYIYIFPVILKCSWGGHSRCLYFCLQLKCSIFEEL